MVKLGTESISDLRLGTSQVQAAYLGDELVWSNYVPPGEFWGLCFTAEEPNAVIAMSSEGTPPSLDLLYSTNASTWSTFTPGTTTVTLANVGDKVWLKAGQNGNNGTASSTTDGWRFSLTNKVAASGSIMSLINGDQETYAISQNYAFHKLFNGCSALTQPPDLPATTITNTCYGDMFRQCTSLTRSPDLPALSCTDSCYANMFRDCTSLSSAGSLSATTVVHDSCVSMFEGCTKLSVAPYLPAKSLNSTCYAFMFRNCSSLASISVEFSAWAGMGTYVWVQGVASSGTFYCPYQLGTNATITRGTSNCPTNWNVVNTDVTYDIQSIGRTTSDQGTSIRINESSSDTIQLVLATSAVDISNKSVCIAIYTNESDTIPYSTFALTSTSLENGFISGTTPELNQWMPSDVATLYAKAWIQDSGYIDPADALGSVLDWTAVVIGDFWGLRLTAQEPNATVSMKANGSAPSLDLLYSTDANTWSTFTPGTTSVELDNVGDCVWFKAGQNGNNGTATSTSDRWQFQISKKVAASGSIMSLINGNEETYKLPAQNATFSGLFKSTPITTAPDLPATNLTEYCYNELFNSCTYMSSCQDVLPAKVPATRAYEQMFSSSGLLKAPQIALSSVSATAIFQGMFDMCYNLTAAPSAIYGDKAEFATFNAMFKLNTSLTATPHLKQCNTNASYAYYQMFTGCSSLQSISTDLTAWGNSNIWVQNVSADGTFYCPSILGTNSTIARGNNRCPNNWTVYNITTLKYNDGTAHMHAMTGSLTKQNVLDAVEEDNQTSGNLRYVYMGQEVTAVAPSAFSDWSYLKGIVIGENVQIVDDNAFRRVSSISSITFAGSSLTAIGPYAFGGVQNTGRYDLPEGLQTIGNNAFVYGGSTPNGLSVVSIPSTVTSIGSSAFSNSNALLSVIFNGKTMDEVTAMDNYPWGASGKIFVN